MTATPTSTPSPSQTIVLLPGQSLEPGVGITGTPEDQAIDVPFSIDVFAVDDFFNVAPGASDTVSITTSDPGDTEPSPRPLVQGHTTFQLLPLTLGAWVVTPSGGPGTNLASAPYRVVSRITTTAGNGSSGFAGDGGPATDASMTNPGSVLVDPAGNMFIADSGNARVRKVSFSGTITTAAQNMQGVMGMALKGDGNLLIVAQLGHAVFSMAPNGSTQQVFGTGIRTGSIDGEGGDSRDDLGDGKQASAASLNFPTAIVLDGGGNSYIADKNNHRVRRVDSATGIITTVAGTGVAGSSGDGGPATSAQLNLPSGLALDSAGNLYIAEQGGNRVRKVTPGGTISRAAGTGTYGYSGDDGPATSAKLASPFGLATDGAGNLYIADANNHRIRKVDSSGIITTVAGNGSPGFSGDGGASTEAGLNEPLGVAVDCAGNMDVADAFNHRIRRLEFAVGLSAGGDGDGDGVSDCEELALGTDPANPDTDGDGFKDKPVTSFAGVNTDTSMDNCPLVYNPDQLNTDGRRRPNGSQIDGDWASNPSQDKLGDACDTDDDNDGLPDSQEYDDQCPYRTVADSDGDTVVDGYEINQGENACSATSKPACTSTTDSDGDGFPDCMEHSGYNTCAFAGDTTPGYTTCANPTDSDGDGCADWIEIVDVNGNREANIVDVLAFAQRAFNVNPPSDSDPLLDINKNGAVNIVDVLLAAQNSSMLRPHSSCPSEG